jgi:hypothetical protein
MKAFTDQRRPSWIWSSLIAMILVVNSITTSAFSPIIISSSSNYRRDAKIKSSGQDNERSTTSLHAQRRRDFLQTIPIVAIVGSTWTASTTTTPPPAFAADSTKEEPPTKAVVTECFDAIRYEVTDTNGGVAYMQSRIDQEDFVGLLEFTKT